MALEQPEQNMPANEVKTAEAVGDTAKVQDTGNKEQDRLSRRFERVVKRAENALLIERAWPHLSLPLGITGAFVISSWFGLWTNLSPSARVTGVALFTTALIASLSTLRNIKKPTREEALARIDSKSPITHRPASVLDDHLSASMEQGETAKQMWSIHRKKMADEIGKLRAGFPQSKLQEYDPYMMRALPVFLGFIAFMGASGEHVSRIEGAFDWRAPVAASAPATIDAWVTAPAYTGSKKNYISAAVKDTGALKSLEISSVEGSTLTVLLHDKKAKLAFEGGILPASEEDKRNSPYRAGRQPRGINEQQFKLVDSGYLTIKTENGQNLRWRFNVTPDQPPEVTITGAGTDEKRDPNSVNVTYNLKDEYQGGRIVEGQIKPVTEPGEDRSEPKPLIGPPQLTIPLR